jgi:ankyrin repeat protein
LTARPALLQHVTKHFAEKGEAFYEEFHTLWDIFEAVTSDSRCGNVICIVDGLDECEELSRLRLIDSLVTFYEKRRKDGPDQAFVKCLITSRPYRVIESRLHALPNIWMEGKEETDAIGADVATFIKKGVASISAARELPGTTQILLENELMTKSDQTFLWVSLALQAVERSPRFSSKAIQEIISTIPSKLDDVYESILRRSPNRKDLKRLLQIMVTASVPLSLEEMNVAFVIKSNDRSTQDLDLEPSIANSIKDICGGFLKIVDSKIHFIHQTARQFLIRSTNDTDPAHGSWKNSLDMMESNAVMAQSCVGYLLLSEFESVLSQSITESFTLDELRHRTKRYAFFEYASKNWGYHFRNAGHAGQEALVPSVMDLYNPKSLRLELWSAAFYWSISTDKDPLIGFTPLMLASYFGHTSVIRELLKTDADVSKIDSKGWTALHWAAWEGHGVLWKGSDAVQLLLDAGINYSARDNMGNTALHWAAVDGQVDLVRILINSGIDHKLRNKNGNMAQHLASVRGYTNVITTLLEAGILVDEPDWAGRPLLFHAIVSKNKRLITLLIKNGASMTRPKSWGTTALQCAVVGGADDIAALLLDLGADIEGKCTGGETALHYASSMSHVNCAKLLLERGAYLEATSETGITPLHLAATQGSIESVQFLLAKGANLQAKANNGCTVLHQALLNKHEGVLQFLVESGAELEAVNNTGHTALHCAASRGDEKTARLLLKLGTNIGAKDKLGWTAMHHAAEGEEGVKVMPLLLQNGLEVSMKTTAECTALHIAASHGRAAAAALLLAEGADLEALDGSGSYSPYRINI